METRKFQEERIRKIIENERSATKLSQELFGQEGLFSKLAPTVDEKKKLVETDIFKTALRKLSQLQKGDVSAFERKIRELSPPVRVTVTLPRDVYACIKSEANKAGASISEIIRDTMSKHCATI